MRERSPTGDQAGLKWPLSNMEKGKSSKVFFLNEVKIEDGEILLEENGKQIYCFQVFQDLKNYLK